MKCPSCASVLAAPEPRCPTCKLSLQKLDAKFVLLPRHSRYLSDRSGTLPLQAMDDLRESLRRFEKKFPQILFSVFVSDLPAGTAIGEYAFWLANRARFSPAAKTSAENCDLLLLIDVGAETAALITGYGLEKYVGEEDLQEALEEFAGVARAEDIVAGIDACVKFLARRLRDCATQAPQIELQAEEAAK